MSKIIASNIKSAIVDIKKNFNLKDAETEYFSVLVYSTIKKEQWLLGEHK